MKTEQLVRALAADRAGRWPSLEHLLLAALAAGGAVAAVIFAWRIGMRPDLAAAALADPRVVLKFLVPLTLAAASAGLLLRLARPGMPAGIWTAGLLVAPALLALGIAYELATFPASAWGARLVGRFSGFCLTSIPMLAAPILIALLAFLRRGAPTRLPLAGTAAGLLAGAAGAFLYAAHCPDDSPLFVLAWYGLAVALVAAVGGLAGPRLLRW